MREARTGKKGKIRRNGGEGGTRSYSKGIKIGNGKAGRRSQPIYELVSKPCSKGKGAHSSRLAGSYFLIATLRSCLCLALFWGLSS